jgi:hypothetical protein
MPAVAPAGKGVSVASSSEGPADPWAAYLTAKGAALGKGGKDSKSSPSPEPFVPPRYSQPPTTKEKDAVPYGERAQGIMGHLGWDSPPENLLENAKLLIAALGVAQGDIVELKPSYGNGGGSSVDVKFGSLALL